MQVVPGKKLMLLARLDGAHIRFSLRAGVGTNVARAPWKEEWGGGASVENPHRQRVHYCELLVRGAARKCLPWHTHVQMLRIMVAHEPVALQSAMHSQAAGFFLFRSAMLWFEPVAGARLPVARA